MKKSIILVTILTASLAYSVWGTDYYVNDNSTNYDIWCTAVGVEGNDGLSPATPVDSPEDIPRSYNLNPGDNIYIDTGTYNMTNSVKPTGDDDGLPGSPVAFKASPYGVICDRGDTSTGRYVWDIQCQYNTVETVDSTVYPDAIKKWMRVTGGEVGFNYTGGNCSVKRVEVCENSKYGFRLLTLGINNVTIEDCIIWGQPNSSDGTGVYVNQANGITLTNCTIYGNGKYGIKFVSGSGFRVINSILHANGSGDYCIHANTTPSQLDYNCYFAEGAAYVGGLISQDKSTLAAWQSTTGKDAHSIEEDPLFVDASADDFHLRSQHPTGTFVIATGAWTEYASDHSPCIDAGSPSSDYSEEQQPNGSQVNIGGYGNSWQASRSIDTDLDGLADSTETNDTSTSPILWDSDGDLAGDGFEVFSGTSPTDVTEYPVELKLDKIVDVENPGIGQVITFTLTASNLFPNTASNVVVSDTLPSGLTFTSYTASAGSYAGGTWTIPSIASGSQQTLDIEAVVDNGSIGLSITNTATITGSAQLDPNETNDSASAAIEISSSVFLDVYSEHGGADPAVGQHTLPPNSEITLSATGSPDRHGPTQYVCIGWSGSGNIPASGTSTSVTATISSASSVTWLWKTQMWLTVGATVGGSVDRSSGWVDMGSNVTLDATASGGYDFDQWLTAIVDDIGPADGTTSNFSTSVSRTPLLQGNFTCMSDVEVLRDLGGAGTLAGTLQGNGTVNYSSGAVTLNFHVPPGFASPLRAFYYYRGIPGLAGNSTDDPVHFDVDEAITVIARFSSGGGGDVDGDTIPDGDEGGSTPFVVGVDDRNVDSDSDGLNNADEYHAGTIAHDGSSVFQAEGFEPAPVDKMILRWSSVTDKTYHIDRSTNLQQGFRTISSGIPASPPINSYTDDVSSAGAIHYRIQVNH